MTATDVRLSRRTVLSLLLVAFASLVVAYVSLHLPEPEPEANVYIVNSIGAIDVDCNFTASSCPLYEISAFASSASDHLFASALEVERARAPTTVWVGIGLAFLSALLSSAISAAAMLASLGFDTSAASLSLVAVSAVCAIGTVVSALWVLSRDRKRY